VSFASITLCVASQRVSVVVVVVIIVVILLSTQSGNFLTHPRTSYEHYEPRMRYITDMTDLKLGKGEGIPVLN
jgi:hypothetical protein